MQHIKQSKWPTIPWPLQTYAMQLVKENLPSLASPNRDIDLCVGGLTKLPTLRVSWSPPSGPRFPQEVVRVLNSGSRGCQGNGSTVLFHSLCKLILLHSKLAHSQNWLGIPWLHPRRGGVWPQPRRSRACLRHHATPRCGRRRLASGGLWRGGVGGCQPRQEESSGSNGCSGFLRPLCMQGVDFLSVCFIIFQVGSVSSLIPCVASPVLRGSLRSLQLWPHVFSFFQ